MRLVATQNKKNVSASCHKVDSILFTEVGSDWEKEYLKRALRDDADTRFFECPAHEIGKELKDIEVLSVFIKSKVDASLIGKMPALKLITTRSTGYDHIDLRSAEKRNIPVCNVPVYGENTVAEHTFALILSLSRNLRKAYLRTLANDFSLDGLIGFDLKGKTLGVVGTGHIGLHVIRIAVSFGMSVLAYDVQEQKFLSEILGFKYVPLEELFRNSDILSLHVPNLPSTHHLINQKTIKLIKKGAILINTARGGLIETGALMKALDDGTLSGVGLDVLEEEEMLLEEKRFLGEADNKEAYQKMSITLKNHVLLKRENVIYTPHMAFYSREAVQRILDTTIDNIRNFSIGQPSNQVHSK